MRITTDTKLKDLLAAYPWLIDEAVKLDAGFAALRSPLGKLLIARSDIAGAAKRTGLDAQTLIEHIEEMIRNHPD